MQVQYFLLYTFCTKIFEDYEIEFLEMRMTGTVGRLPPAQSPGWAPSPRRTVADHTVSSLGDSVFALYSLSLVRKKPVSKANVCHLAN